MPNKIKYPALYADVEPATAPDGKRGSIVRCTATQQELGFVWWSADSKGVTWHWRVDTVTGTRTTERNAVQALRDRQNGAIVDAPSSPVRRARRPLQERLEEIFAPRPGVVDVEVEADVAPARPMPTAPVQQIVWGAPSSGSAADLTAAVQAAFRKHTKEN